MKWLCCIQGTGKACQCRWFANNLSTHHPVLSPFLFTLTLCSFLLLLSMCWVGWDGAGERVQQWGIRSLYCMKCSQSRCQESPGKWLFILGCNDQCSLIHFWAQLNKMVIRVPFSWVQIPGLVNSHFLLTPGKASLGVSWHPDGNVSKHI